MMLFLAEVLNKTLRITSVGMKLEQDPSTHGFPWYGSGQALQKGQLGLLLCASAVSISCFSVFLVALNCYPAKPFDFANRFPEWKSFLVKLHS